EVLVVVVVIAIASGVVIASLDGDNRTRTEREAKRLAGALEHAAALAQWKGETLGVSADGPAYRFWRRRADDRWIALAADDVLAVELTEGMRAVAQSADAATLLKQRTLALWVAQNRLASAQLETPWPALGRRDGAAAQANANFVWRETVSGTPKPAFRKIEIV